MPREYKFEVTETVYIDVTYVVEADSHAEALRKAAEGDTMCETGRQETAVVARFVHGSVV